MGLGLTNGDWQNMQTSYTNTKYYRTNSQKTNFNGSKAATPAISAQGNTCTDGKDDGKIGFFSAAGNVVEGIGKAGVNMVKNAVKHPFKTAAMIGACCIPIVGPVIAGGLAAYGIANGAATVAKGVKNAMSATTDAQAKDAWENVGNGTFTTAASALALKGSASVLKNQLTGGSTTVSAVEGAIKEGASKTEILKTALTEGAKETGANASNVAKAITEKGKQGIETLKKGSEYVKENGVGASAKTLAQKGLSKVQEGANAVSEKAAELKAKAKTIETPAQIKANSIELAQQAKLDGATVELYENGVPKTIKYETGEVWEFSSSGKLKTTSTIENLGSNTTRTTTQKGNTTTIEIDNTNSAGELTNSYQTKVNSDTGVTTTESLSQTSNGALKGTWGKTNSQTGYGYQTKGVIKGEQAAVETTYTIGNKTYTASELSALQKGIVRYNSGSLGTYTKNVLEAQLPISNEILMGSAVLDTKN